MSSVRVVNNQRYSLNVGSSLRQSAHVKWPWNFPDQNVAEASDDYLIQQVVGYSEYMMKSISDHNEELHLQRIESGKCDNQRVKVDSKSHIYTVHATANFPAKYNEVLELFDDKNATDLVTTRAFRSKLISNREIRRCIGNPMMQMKCSKTITRYDSDDAKSTISSTTSSKSGTTTHDISSFSIKKAVFQESRGPFAKSPERDMLYFDYLEHKSDTCCIRTIKSIDDLNEWPTFKKSDLPLERHQYVLMSYHIEAIGNNRVRVSFVGHYSFQHGSLDDTKRILNRFGDAVDLMPRMIFQMRLAVALFSTNRAQYSNPREPGYACRLCAKTFNAFTKHRLCRLCGQDTCSNCSRVEEVPTTNDIVIDARICNHCSDSINQGDDQPKQTTHTTILLASSLKRTLSIVEDLPQVSFPLSSTQKRIPNLARAASTPSMINKQTILNGDLRHSILQDNRHATLYDVACMATARRIGCENAAVTLIDRHGALLTKSVYGKAPHDLFIREAVHMKYCVIQDAASDCRFANSPAAHSTRFFYGLPLATPDGLLLGVVSVSDELPRVQVDEDNETNMYEFQQNVIKLLLGSTRRTTSQSVSS